MTRSRISESVDQSVFYPTAIAYFLVVLGYLRTGLAVYLTFLIVAYFVGWFKRITQWPLFTKLVLACGPFLLGLGYILSTQNFTGGMLAPGIIYYVVSLVGVAALKRLDND